MADKDREKLIEGIVDYLRWIKSAEGNAKNDVRLRYSPILMEFVLFTMDKDISWKDMFTFTTLRDFRQYSGFESASRAFIAFSDYLFNKGRIDKPIQIPAPKPTTLPDLYEQYLLYHKQSLQVSDEHLKQVWTLLGSFHEYLERNSLKLSKLDIKHLDAFLAEFKVAQSTRKTYLYHLRGFVKYLYYERGILKKDLAPLLVGPPMFAQDKPPKFLRSGEVKKLFASLKLATPADIRTYAIVHLVYTLGLRPVEVSRITFDDISFKKGELTLRQRKADNPITLPIPEDTLKAIAAYVLKARPKSPDRHIFLSHHVPYRALKGGTIVGYLSRVMKNAGLSSSGYWLRHTYAQNLLEMGRTIYEVKEMLGHQNIQSSERYLHIHTELMRKVLFNEEL